jgi:hypothetical protein
MSRQTSRGKASVVQICEAFRVSPQAYYRSRHRPEQAQETALALRMDLGQPAVSKAARRGEKLVRERQLHLVETK